ncbi:MAG: cysteine dioxygenase family protein [Pseudomonadota bacterium]
MTDVEATVDNIKANLCRMIRGHELEIPAHVLAPVEGHYARRLLKRDTELGYSIVAMTWGPCQSTAIHDHAGMWCVEGVWAGSIDVEQYELTGIDANHNRFRFEKRNSYEAGVGSAGCLIPPYEYHLIANPCERSPAVSIHIYGGEMTACHVFEPLGDGWFERHDRPLAYDH